jgi:F-box domain
MTTFNFNINITTMPSIPLDVLREIMGHVSKADLPTLCRVNKTFRSCSQDVLYRDIYYPRTCLFQTLAQSTDLARRVRSFHTSGDDRCIARALRNMSSLRRLGYRSLSDDASILDGCTFKLDSFACTLPYSESLRKFLNGQSSLTKLAIRNSSKHPPPFEETFLPNLTRIRAESCWLRMLIPGRPVTEVMVA